MLGVVNGYKKKLATKALQFGLRHNRAYFDEKVIEVSRAVAREYIEMEMQNQGLIHCHFCLTRSPLKNVGGVYVCNQHTNQVKSGDQNG